MKSYIIVSMISFLAGWHHDWVWELVKSTWAKVRGK